MKYSEETLEIFTTAATIFERLHENWDYVAYPSEEMLSAHKKHWERILSKEDGEERLQRFLQYEQLPEDALAKMFAEVQVNAETSIPDWLNILERALAIYRTGKGQTSLRKTLDSDGEHISFGELLLPWVQVYREERQIRISATKGVIYQAVFEALENSFLEVVAKVAKPTLFDQMMRFGNSKFDEHEYRQFIIENSDRNFIFLLKKFPILARLLSTFTINLASAHARFVNRIAKDYEEIKATFFEDRAIGRLFKVKNSASDFHKGGESVILLKFESGDKLVYKPKNLGLAEQFNGLLAWINAEGSPSPFKQTKLINKKDYGWVEYIDFKECQSPKEVQQYYRRAGALLCLCYLLEGTDFHYENIIAAGAYPVIVDFETILSPRAVLLESAAKSIAKTEAVRHSVIRTCLLPISTEISNNAINMGGFGGKVSANTEGLDYAEQRVNVPHLNGDRCPVSGYGAELKEGFRSFYCFITTKKHKLLGAQSPLHTFKHLPVRVLFRNTFVYNYVIKKLSKPQSLENGINFSLQMEVLAKGLLRPAIRPVSWPVLKEERASLMSFDFPFFVTTTCSTDLMINEGCDIKHFFQKASYDAMYELIEGMSEEQLLRQLQCIDSALDILYSESPPVPSVA